MKKLAFALLTLLQIQPLYAQELLSSAMGRWIPTREGECTKAQHDAYSAVGPDGKLYPVWHPPVDPSGCYFGHEHGDNPNESPLGKEPVLFGYVNEQHALQDKHGHRHEDHVGHKVFVLSQFPFKPSGGSEEAEPLQCDILTKLHQGTHSADAMTNNLHEQYNRMSCTDGTYVNVQLLSQIGPAGQIQEQGSSARIEVGPPVPEDSPRTSNPLNPGKSMGNRFLPTARNVGKARPSFFEIWKTQNTITAPGGKNYFRFAWYWSVGNPSRYYDPAQPNMMGRSVDSCWAATPNIELIPDIELATEDEEVVADSELSADITFLIKNGPCVKLRQLNAENSINWDDPRSPFTGAQRGVRPDSFTLRNGTGPTVWYTDALGMNPSTEPFPGSVKQEVGNKSHTPVQYSLARRGGGISRNFTATGVHAPN